MLTINERIEAIEEELDMLLCRMNDDDLARIDELQELRLTLYHHSKEITTDEGQTIIVSASNLRPEEGYECSDGVSTMYMCDITVTTEQGSITAPLYEYGHMTDDNRWKWENTGNCSYYNGGTEELDDAIGDLFMDDDSEYHGSLSSSDMVDIVETAYALMLRMK